MVVVLPRGEHIGVKKFMVDESRGPESEVAPTVLRSEPPFKQRLPEHHFAGDKSLL
jgi:hypothetical protein